MRKKYLMIGASVIVGVAMMATAAFAGAGTTGYDTYKTAFKNTMAAQSATATVAVTVADNGNTVLNLDGASKMDLTGQAMSGNMTAAAGSEKQTMAVYRQNGQVVTKCSDSDVYKVMPVKPEQQQRQADPAVAADAQKVIDLLAGNLQQYITQSGNADGSTQVTLSLSGDQISPLANAVASLVVRSHGRDRGQMGQPENAAFAKAIEAGMPKLVDNIKVNSVLLQASIDSQNMIKTQTATIAISGQDASGASHVVAVNISVNLSNFNNTTPDKIDLTGKQVQQVQPHQMRGAATPVE